MENNLDKNLRVKEIRKSLNLTLEEFGKRLGVTKSAISRIENNIANLTDQILISICNIYNVSEDWLRNGNGEMFIQSKYDILDEFSKMYDLDDLDKAIFSEYIKLDYKDRKIIKKYIVSVIEKYNSSEEKKKTKEELEKERIDKEVEAYRKELEEESKRAEKLSVSKELREIS